MTLGSVALAIALALLVPATTVAASPFRYTVLRSECLPNYSQDPIQGDIYMKVKVKEVGLSGANYFRVRTTVKFKFPGNTRWTLYEDSGWQYSRSFVNDSESWYHVRTGIAPYWWNYPFRMVMKVQVRSDTQGLLSEASFSQTCTGNVG
ncbi:MAG TPA: hypothetical protein VEX62_10440 [Candidatus Limnocylindrales bacterium]|nr:hypothetical protein [Candidatus Limnocylindrales bacterium]